MSVDIMQDILRESDDLKYHCLPAVVVSYSGGIATVQPSLLHLDIEGNSTIMPKIYNVPVVFQRTKMSGVTFKLFPGDQGELRFSDQSLENWKENAKDKEINPGDIRKSHLTDAIFYPGLFQIGKGSEIDNEGLTVVDGECKIKIKDNKIAIGNSTAELLQIINDLITALTTATTLVAGAPVILTCPTLPDLLTKLTTLKGAL